MNHDSFVTDLLVECHTCFINQSCLAEMNVKWCQSVKNPMNEQPNNDTQSIKIIIDRPNNKSSWQSCATIANMCQIFWPMSKAMWLMSKYYDSKPTVRNHHSSLSASLVADIILYIRMHDHSNRNPIIVFGLIICHFRRNHITNPQSSTKQSKPSWSIRLRRKLFTQSSMHIVIDVNHVNFADSCVIDALSIKNTLRHNVMRL